MKNLHAKSRAGRPIDAGLPVRRKSAIIRAAIDEFARNGFAGADLDAIAESAGCSKGTLYNYFRSKGHLFSASVDHVMFSMVKAIGPEDAGDFLDQLAHRVYVFLNHFAQHPEYVELLVQERSDFRDRKQPSYYRYRESNRRKWMKQFKKLMAEGRMRKMSPETALNIVTDLLYGTMFLNHFRQRKIHPRKQAGELMAVLFGGLLPEKEYFKRTLMPRR